MSKAICSVKTPGCTYLGINATEKISGILEKENAKKVIVLTIYVYETTCIIYTFIIKNTSFVKES